MCRHKRTNTLLTFISPVGSPANRSPTVPPCSKRSHPDVRAAELTHKNGLAREKETELKSTKPRLNWLADFEVVRP